MKDDFGLIALVIISVLIGLVLIRRRHFFAALFNFIYSTFAGFILIEDIFRNSPLVVFLASSYVAFSVIFFFNFYKKHSEVESN